jgi:hypothetical protein
MLIIIPVFSILNQFFKNSKTPELPRTTHTLGSEPAMRSELGGPNRGEIEPTHITSDSDESLPEWLVRDYYQCASWIDATIFSSVLSGFVTAIMFFWDTVEYSEETGLLQLPPVWMLQYGLIGFIFGFPLSCVFTVWSGLLLEEEIRHVQIRRVLVFFLSICIHAFYQCYSHLGPDGLDGDDTDVEIMFVRLSIVTACLLVGFSAFCIMLSVRTCWKT